MKKYISILLVMILTLTMTAGCQKNVKNSGNTESNAAKDTLTETVQEATSAEDPAKSEENTEEAESAESVAPEEKMDIHIAALKGPTAMGMVKIMDDSEKGEAANNYDFTIAGAPDEITAGIIKGNFDIAAIPCNLAAVLYNKSKGGLVVAGINTLGVLYVVETGKEINSVEDLKGKTIYSTGKGTTPEYTLNYLLSSHGIDPAKDVTIEYKSEATEVATVLKEATDAVAMLPQPFVTTVMMNNKNLRIALDVTKEWDKISENGSTVVTGVIVINKKFLETNKAAVDTFLSEYEESAQYVNSNKEAAAALIEKFDIFKAAPVLKALPYCNITSIQGEDMKGKISGYLETLFEQNPDTVGGKLPDESFYYIK
ncbi:ABC transporter substrate-binding protein [Anaerocolumna sp. MB42-C2]|uniref:ABC transporter substrate-binding protein n=1 Tax=Anaerocolumna sp. MB42-C2 TaxID=3070997 RepID=UPI0027E100D8|nr:ABC transporter substrate-binding protein [Anaerocolumna sp. MB42-C2]WMJ85301.1 ABC transporter substrate-binding protein [Anaerocolumna sp. MB42-C2]